MKKNLMILVVLWGGVLSALAAEPDRVSPPKYPSYELTAVQHYSPARAGERYRGNSIVLLDIDGDGSDEFINSTFGYITAQKFNTNADVTLYQTNLPPEFEGLDALHAIVSMVACADLDGDGRENLIAWGNTPDHQKWRFWNLDPATGRIISEFDLTGGPDVRQDGQWDGVYYVTGSVPVIVKGQEIPALIIGCTVGYDRYNRRIMAVDPRNGDILWNFALGPNPFFHNTRIADLDGDGQSEIIVLGRAPDNLGGELINGTSDNETRLFVLDQQGRLRWSQRLGGSYGNGEFDLADMTRDGRLEIITSARTTPDIWGELVVWDHRGESVASHADSTQFDAVRVVQREDRDYPSLLVTSSNSQLQEFDFTPEGLTWRRGVLLESYGHIGYVGDFLPARGSEIIVSTHAGPTYIFDSRLRPMAVTEAAKRAWNTETVVWRPNPKETYLIWPNMLAPALLLSKAPFVWARLLPYAYAAGVLLFVGAVWLIVRRPRRIDAHLLRETRLNLLDNLELSSHGAIAPLKCVRRLVWHLRALQSDLGDSEKVEIRMREAWTECHESAVPHLKGILDRAQLAGLASDSIGIVSNATTEIEKQLEILAQNNFRDATCIDIAERMEAAENRADTALIRLRNEVATYFRADVAEVMTRVRAANDLAFSEANLAFQMGQAAVAAGTDVAGAPPKTAPVGLCDPRELEFVLDNLVGNAIAAMGNATVRQLQVTWRTADGMLLIDVTDTGRGLREEDWNRALNTRYSTKATGGEGLPTSRKFLRKYGGNLTIVRSAPSKGSTFRVTLPTN
ncbi:MAG: ATP-binding protein [Candidatus Krumholzibacteria bacterium]|nr:ATP-binding protein [Candidatus Krumholzibacteria bacterium]